MNQTTANTLELESLFQQAAATEPDLTDSNFTKIVLNRLPARSEVQERRNWLPDAIGIFVSVFAIGMLADPAELIAMIPSELPTNAALSVPDIVVAAGTLMVASLLGWYIVERDF